MVVTSSSNSSLFVQQTNNTLTILLIYVDDILLIGNYSSNINSLIAHMHSVVSMKELGDINFFLCISIVKSFSGYFLSQSKYALEILGKVGMIQCKACASPMSVKPSSAVGSSCFVAFSKPSLYWSIVGAPQYLTITRLDIAFVANYACQAM